MDSGAAKLELLQRGRLLTVKEVRLMWPVSRDFLHKITTHPNPSERLTSYRYGDRIFYSFDDLMYYRENHRFEPKKRRSTHE